MAKATIAGTDTVNAALETKCNSNFTELYNYLTGTTAPTLLTPTIASFANATHTHANAAGGGTLTAAVLGGTITGTYTLGGTPTITTPTITVADWVDITITGSGWGVLSTFTVSVMKDPMGFIHMKGVAIATGSADATLFTLDADYRPATHARSFAVNLDDSNVGGVGALSIATDGTVNATYRADGDLVYFDSIPPFK